MRQITDTVFNTYREHCTMRTGYASAKYIPKRSTVIKNKKRKKKRRKK